jgi:hypothetical protein
MSILTPILSDSHSVFQTAQQRAHMMAFEMVSPMVPEMAYLILVEMMRPMAPQTKGLVTEQTVQLRAILELVSRHPQVRTRNHIGFPGN